MKDDKPNPIKEFRKTYGLTQETAARILGVSPRSVAHWECGTRNVSRSILLLIDCLTADQKGGNHDE